MGRIAGILTGFIVPIIVVGLLSACASQSPSPVDETKTTPPKDTSPPVTSANNMQRWYDHSVRISLKATDDQSGVAATNYRVDGGPWTEGTAIRLTDVGRHVVVYRSTDNAGNKEVPAKDWVGIDKTPPSTFALNSPSGTAGKRIVIKFKVKDRTPKARVRVAVKGSSSKVIQLGLEPTNRTRTCSVTLKAGDYTYQILATDLAGNVGPTPGVGQIHVTSEHPTKLEGMYYIATGSLGHRDLPKQIGKAYKLLMKWPDWTVEDPFRRALIEKDITDLCNKGALADYPSGHFVEAQRLFERMLDSANAFVWALSEVNPSSSFAAWERAAKDLKGYFNATYAWGDALSSAWTEAKRQ